MSIAAKRFSFVEGIITKYLFKYTMSIKIVSISNFTGTNRYGSGLTLLYFAETWYVFSLFKDGCFVLYISRIALKITNNVLWKQAYQTTLRLCSSGWLLLIEKKQQWWQSRAMAVDKILSY